MLTSATSLPSPIVNPTIARQPGVGGNIRRPLPPQRLVPTQNLQPINGNSLQTARTSAQANGFSVPAGSPFWTNGVINVALINGKSSVVSLAPGVDTLQLADQMFNARGLSSSDRKKELIPGFTVAQYLAWRDASLAFNQEEPGIGTNRRGLELAKTAELFERKLVNSINLAYGDLRPELQMEELQRIQQRQREAAAATKKRREGRGCEFAAKFLFQKTSSGNISLAAATSVKASKDKLQDPTAIVKVEQQLTLSVPYSTDGSSQKTGKLKASATAPGLATAGSNAIVGDTVGTAIQDSRAVCTWPDGHQMIATPAIGNPVAPTKATGWYSETRRFFGL